MVKSIKQKAAAGDIEANGQIGLMLVEGRVMKRDAKRGLELMTLVELEDTQRDESFLLARRPGKTATVSKKGGGPGGVVWTPRETFFDSCGLHRAGR